MDKGLVSSETMVKHQQGVETNVWFINRVIIVHIPRELLN